MAKVINIFKKRAEKLKEEDPVKGWAAKTEEQYHKDKEKRERERMDANRSVLRSYRIKN